MPEIKHKFDKKRLFFFEILGLFFFFRLKVIFSPMCLQNKTFDLRPKNWKTLNILEHFWYLGHFHNPTRTYFFMTKKICKKKEKKMKFLIFWKKFGKKIFFFLQIFIFQALIALLLGVLETSWGYEKCSPSFGESKKTKNEPLRIVKHTTNFT